jgi:drug/metabolite transporter (DMT)-like permease
MTYFKAVMPPAVYYMLLSALGFALMAACVKGASEYGIPVLEIVAARAVVSLFISYIDIKRKRIDVWGQNKGLLIARGSVGAIALLCVYYAVTTLPLAEATIMQYTYPAFTALIALLFLKEKVQKATLLCIVLSLVGLVLMVQPTHGSSNLSSLPWLSVMAALAGALGSAIAYVLVRKLSQTEDSSVIIFYFPLIALPISVIFLGSDFVMPSAEALLLLILVGIFTQVGQVGLTKAMQTEYAGKVSAYAYVQVVFSVVLGFVFFDEIPPDLTWLGGGLIIMGALVNVFWKR